MGRIKPLVDRGISFPAAIKAVLGKMTINEFAAFEGSRLVRVPATAVSSVINGSTPYRYDNVRQKLAIFFEEDREWIDEQCDRMRQEAVRNGTEAVA